MQNTLVILGSQQQNTCKSYRSRRTSLYAMDTWISGHPHSSHLSSYAPRSFWNLRLKWQWSGQAAVCGGYESFVFMLIDVSTKKFASCSPDKSTWGQQCAMHPLACQFSTTFCP